MKLKKYKTGIVLSGGGARGFAHLGVLKALNDAGIYPDVIAGTSAGALVGVLYADGYTPDEILKIMNTTSKLHYIRPTVPREGLLQISGIERILNENQLRILNSNPFMLLQRSVTHCRFLFRVINP
jgi:NTE family protein